MLPQINTKSGNQRDYRLDFVKAVCSFFVLFRHLEPIDISIPNIQAFGINIIFKELLIAFYFQVTMLGVPVFLTTSFYLYFRNYKKKGRRYFLKRMGDLFLIYLFWFSCQIAAYYYLMLAGSHEALIKFFTRPWSSWYILIQHGGPPLPFVGDSVFYFLFDLIVLTIFATLFVEGEKIKWLNEILGGSIILFSLARFQYGAYHGESLFFSSEIFDLVVYVPVAYFIRKYESKISRPLVGVFLLCSIFFSYQDYLLRQQGLQWAAFGRVSIVLGALTLFSAVIMRKNVSPSKVVRFLAGHSQGIFAIHKYCEYAAIVALAPLYEAWQIRKKIPVWEFQINFQVMGIAVLAVLLTFSLVFVLGRTPLKRFVT